MTPDQIPHELIDMLDQAAGRTHNPDGRVLRTLAAILTRYDELRELEGGAMIQLRNGSNTITLEIKRYGSIAVTLPYEEYREAKDAGRLDHLLDCWISDMHTDCVIIEPDGTEVFPFG